MRFLTSLDGYRGATGVAAWMEHLPNGVCWAAFLT
jgi:hypothetical protein